MQSGEVESIVVESQSQVWILGSRSMYSFLIAYFIIITVVVF